MVGYPTYFQLGSEPEMNANAPLTDATVVAISKLIDDSMTERREPSHSDIEFQINRQNLRHADPSQNGQTVGKAKRLRGVLNWCLDNDGDSGSKLIAGILATVQGCGGFRDTSPNYVGRDAIAS